MIPAQKTLRRKNFKHLQLDPAVNKQQEAAPPTPQPLNLMAGVEFNLHPQRADLETVAELGFGNGGAVSKVVHVPTRTVMAKKVIYLETNPKVQKSIQQELETLQKCDSEYIVKYYGQFIEARSVTICMEYMDCGSLDKIYKQMGPIHEDIIACINVAVVDGINYLKELNITHRDVKPSNILVNSQGEIKLCDFGVSGVLINSIAETFVGTSTYMSPERIAGETYSATGDVWSLGLTLVELAAGKFPFEIDAQAGTPFSIFELLQRIVNEPPPTPPPGCSPAFQDFIKRCLQPQADQRMTPRELPNSSFYIKGKHGANVLPAWARTLPII